MTTNKRSDLPGFGASSSIPVRGKVGAPYARRAQGSTLRITGVALSQLHDFSNDELRELIGTLKSARPNVALDAIGHYMDLTVCAATGILYRRLEEQGDHQAALVALAVFTDTEWPPAQKTETGLISCQ